MNTCADAMTAILKQWIQFAHADLDAAKRLFHTPRPTRWTYLLVLWHCHQATEKMLKAVLVGKGKELLKIHDLPRLVQLAEVTLSAEDRHFITRLNKFYLRSRYPDLISVPLPSPTKKDTAHFLRITEKFFLWLQQP